jgi:glycosyltransferase involved in cell wall biosynthesis
MPERGRFRSTYQIPADTLLILFLGRLSAKKSPDLLLQAFAQLPEKIGGKQLRLAFAGPDESGMQGRLEQLARAKAVDKRIVFSGPLYDKMKWAAYRDADVFVLPSQNENFGNTAAEAAACGTPVVITENCGVAPLLAGIAGLMVPHETAAVAGAVKEILSNPALLRRLSEGGSTVANGLGWDEPVYFMEQMYARLAGQPPVGDNRQSSGPGSGYG